MGNIRDEKLQNNQNSFLESIKIEQNKEKLRLMEIKRRYECGEISENEISDEDIKKIIELYDEEIQDIKSDTRSIKYKIKKELEELKSKSI